MKRPSLPISQSPRLENLIFWKLNFQISVIKKSLWINLPEGFIC